MKKKLGMTYQQIAGLCAVALFMVIGVLLMASHPAQVGATGNDYAETVLSDAWDFNEGDTEGIDYWSSGIAGHTVSGGNLNLTNTDINSPYFWWESLNIATATYHQFSIRVNASSGTQIKLHTYRYDGTYVGYCYVGIAGANTWTVLGKNLTSTACWNGTIG